ncbi:MAG: hypothetical protein JW893_06570 [Candidatus Omnitrophica bacterium]|nr:hypothetical protein [Candidatus Omnitrophota bacterium]
MFKKGLVGRNQSKGFILITSYFLIAALSMLSLAFLMRGNVFLNSVERNMNRYVAFHMAEAGVDIALATLNTSPNYAGTGGYTSLGNNGGYRVDVCPPTCDGLTQPTGSNIRLISATGFAPSNSASDRGFETRTVTVYASVQSDPTFQNAIFSNDLVALVGSGKTDSYDSRDGAYGGDNLTQEGHVRTNATADDRITLIGSPDIYGDAVVGPEADPSDVIFKFGLGIKITGEQTSAAETKDYESVEDVSVSSTEEDGALFLTGEDVVYLNEGTYDYSSVTVANDAEIIALGPITMNVSGNVSFLNSGSMTSVSSVTVNTGGAFSLVGDASLETGGTTEINSVGSVNIIDTAEIDSGGPTTITASDNVRLWGRGVVTYDNDPTNLVLNVPDGSPVTLIGDDQFYGAIYAPDSLVTIIGSADIFGGVISEDFICVANCGIHYDAALEAVGVGQDSAVEVLSWVENDTVAAS